MKKKPCRISLRTAYNIRSLGGYPMSNGGCTAHTFFRGDCLRRLSKADTEILLALGVRTVIDLRGEDERSNIPNALAEREEISYVPIPLLLMLAGVEQEIIVSDYAYTGQYLAPVRERLAKVSKTERYSPPQQKILLSCDGPCMEKMLDYIKDQYTGIRSYLEVIGLTKEECDILEKSMKYPAADWTRWPKIKKDECGRYN